MNPSRDFGLGEILSADQCKAQLKTIACWSGTAVYLLWHPSVGRPVYCGTANSARRILGHLHKDDLRNGPIGKTHTNPELRAYCLSQPKGWLGVQFKLLQNEETARQTEQQIIAHFGIRRAGGTLFNQRFSG
jgi:hypothetical protein